MQKLWLLILLSFSSCAIQLADNAITQFVITTSEGTFEDKVSIEWLGANIYKFYEVYRSTEETGTYKLISEQIKSKSFLDETVELGRGYYYRVRGYNELDVPIFLSKPSLGYAGVIGGFFPPSNIRVNDRAYPDRIVLEWDIVKEAKLYEIWRSEDNEIFSPIGRTAFLEYEDKNLERGKTFYYQISSIQEDEDGIETPSPNRSPTVTASTFGGNINISSLAGVFKDKIELTWTKVPNVKEYLIYRSEMRNDPGIFIAAVNPNDPPIYVDTSVKESTLYYYTIYYGHETALLASDTVRSYVFVESAPAQPQNVVASQGTFPDEIKLTWDSVPTATMYEVVRGIAVTGPWEAIATVEEPGYTDIPPTDQYTYFYKIIPLNPALGAESVAVEGWANRPPSNIKATDNFGQKVQLTWDPVPGAKGFNIYYATAVDGPYTFVGEAKNTVYDHIVDIGDVHEKELFYQMDVNTDGGISDRSPTVKGVIKKIGSPNNLTITGNKTATKSISFRWDLVNGAKGYAIYRATLRHKNANHTKLVDSDFKKIADVQNNAYQATFSTYPIRRYVYKIYAIDRGDARGIATTSEIIYRYPADIRDFLMDVDFTIVHAQTKVPGFGSNGSSGKVNGRVHGVYDYRAAASGSKSNWDNYSSFEINIHGSPRLSVNINDLSAYMNGPVNISGLYKGKITYNNLRGLDGGTTAGGSITAEYQHPTQGWIKQTFNHNEASFLISVVVSPETSPVPPKFEEGGG